MKKYLLIVALLATTNFFSQKTYIPDDNFEQALINLGYDDVLDDSVNTNTVAFIETLNISFMGIEDLTGIEDFLSLYYLDCFSNKMSHFDFSQNINLRWINCSAGGGSDYPLLSVNVSGCYDLEILYCVGYPIPTPEMMESLDLSTNTALRELYCGLNRLSSLDLSNNGSLEVVNCVGNDLSCVNLRNANNFNISYLNLINNPNLYCVEVDDADYSESLWFDIDAQTSFSEDCNNDCSSTSSLTELTSSKNLIQILDMMGRETSFKPNTPLIYVYDDGSTEKVFTIED